MEVSMTKTKPFLLALVLTVVPAVRADDTKAEGMEKLQKAAATLREIAATPDKGIPEEVLSRAKCIAVVPNLTKAGFILGGQHGSGAATCRTATGWSAPVFLEISGGSWGAQIGVESVDLVMTIMNDDGMRELLKNKFQIGGAVSAAAGPIGRHATAGTDWKADSQILTYSRSKGLFAGVELGGSWIERDKDQIVAFYGRDIPTDDLINGKVSAPADAKSFLDEVSRVAAKG
jgi:SH3 domain-containing YSC84-like protein 1